MYRKHRLNDRLTTFSSLCFPYKNKKSNIYRYQVVVGIGGNIGDVKTRFRHLFFFLQREKRISLVRTSLILQNPPFGYSDQDDFLNSILVINTSMTAKVFLNYLLHTEKKFGRTRSFPNAPRTLDLDIIFFNNQVIKSEKLKVPHPHWHERESVVIPLAGLQI